MRQISFKSTNMGAGQLEFGSSDGGKDGEHSGDDFVEISNIFEVRH